MVRHHFPDRPDVLKSNDLFHIYCWSIDLIPSLNIFSVKFLYIGIKQIYILNVEREWSSFTYQPLSAFTLIHKVKVKTENILCGRKCTDMRHDDKDLLILCLINIKWVKKVLEFNEKEKSDVEKQCCIEK